MVRRTRRGRPRGEAGWPSGSGELDGEAERAADDRAVAGLNGAGQGDRLDSLGEQAERYRAFQSGQRLAQAVVDAGREGQVRRRVLPGDVERAGVRVDL